MIGRGVIPHRPPFQHLLRLSDDVGVLEHAAGPIPRRNCGYCLDDNARALIVLCRQPAPSAELERLRDRCLAFVLHAQDTDGLFRNRLSYDRRWEDSPAAGDWWGRGLWALGVVAAHHPLPGVRPIALAAFARGAKHRPSFTRSMAYAALGAAEVLQVDTGQAQARDLLAAAVASIGETASSAWPWPEPRLSYANAALPDALVAAGAALADEDLLARGLELLDWLAEIETRDGHLSVTPVGGSDPGQPRPAFDQQPIEVATLAEAGARAYEATRQPRWLELVRRSADWFGGSNDTGAVLYDAETGGGCDGLLPSGRNANQGAESTLALIATLQHAHRLGVWRRAPAPATGYGRGG
jgi:hypothetical protein